MVDDSSNGFAWWRLGPGERSSTATVYDGFDTSRQLVLDAIQRSNDNNGPFDLILGHSQGGILVTALLALHEMDCTQQHHPAIGYILNGVAWPNPYTAEFLKLPMLHQERHPQDGRGGNGVSKSPRVLLLIGARDTINPPEQGARVGRALEAAGYAVTTISHPRGHALPTERGSACWESIQQWILRGVASAH
jgi:predicted esterase